MWKHIYVKSNKKATILVRKKIWHRHPQYVPNFESRFFTGAWHDGLYFKDKRTAMQKLMKWWNTIFLQSQTENFQNYTDLVYHMRWKHYWYFTSTVKNTKCHHARVVLWTSQPTIWFLFGLLPLPHNHGNNISLRLLCTAVELIAAFSYLVAGLCLRKRFREKAERKCPYVRSCCLLWERRHRCCCTLVACLESWSSIPLGKFQDTLCSPNVYQAYNSGHRIGIAAQMWALNFFFF